MPAKDPKLFQIHAIHQVSAFREPKKTPRKMPGSFSNVLLLGLHSLGIHSFSAMSNALENNKPHMAQARGGRWADSDDWSFEGLAGGVAAKKGRGHICKLIYSKQI